MEKAKFDEIFKKSHDKFLYNSKWLEISKNELIKHIEKVSQNETKDIKLIIQLKFLEKLSIKEIREVLDKSETSIYHYLQYIISKINSIMFEEAWKEVIEITDDLEKIADEKLKRIFSEWEILDFKA